MTILKIDGNDVLVDDEDASKVSNIKWYVNKKNARKYSLFYFEHLDSSFDKDGVRSRRVKSLHGFIAGCVYGDGKTVDHVDGNTLNNQKYNLRVCTNRGNSCNNKISKRNKSGYKGVSYNKRDKRWYATITVKRKGLHLGCFKSPEEAYEKWKQAAIIYHGQFARFE